MSNSLMLSRPDGTPITGWVNWTPPKKAYQWKEGRSAQELAKAWFPQRSLTTPDELMALLHSQSRFAGIQLIRGIPECVTPLPVKGEGRNHDLWLLGRTDTESVTICVEAKADEPFGNETVSEYRGSAMKRRRAGTPTMVPERIDALLGIVGGRLSDWADVRYQLLTAICGTILQARMDLQECTDLSGCGVFVVHEFQTNSTTPENLQRNDADYRAFLEVLGIRLDTYRDGVLLGPVPLGGTDCFFGKATKCPTVVLGVAGKGTKVGGPGR